MKRKRKQKKRGPARHTLFRASRVLFAVASGVALLLSLKNEWRAFNDAIDNFTGSFSEGLVSALGKGLLGVGLAVLVSWLALSYIRVRRQRLHDKTVDAREQLEVEEPSPEQEAVLRLLSKQDSTENELRDDPPALALGIAILAVAMGIGMMVLPSDGDPPRGFVENDPIVGPKEKKKGKGAPRNTEPDQRDPGSRGNGSGDGTRDQQEVLGKQSSSKPEPPVEGEGKGCVCPPPPPIEEEPVPQEETPPPIEEEPPFEEEEEEEEEFEEEEFETEFEEIEFE